MRGFESVDEEAPLGRRILFDGHLMDGAIVQPRKKGNPLCLNGLRALFLIDSYLIEGLIYDV